LGKIENAIEFKNIKKVFGTVVANSNVTMEVRKGEILALLGENGSGKTTLMNMLSGIYYPDEGSIWINGREVVIASPRDAFELGIGMVHQHFKLVDVFTAAENIVLGLEGKLDRKEINQKLADLKEIVKFNIDYDEKIYNMSVSQRQQVEILKVLYRGAEIIILDEPTAVLTPQETEELFDTLRLLKDKGKTIIIITHKLNEVKAVSDRVAILRKGEYIDTIITAESDAQRMTDMMVGKSVSLNIDRPEPVNPKPRILVEGLSIKDAEGTVKIGDVSFVANAGEILGIAGISGCGQKELLEAIAGLQRVEAGSIKFVEDDGEEEEILGKNPREIQKMGVALSFVPEDRLGMGLVGNMNLSDNMMLRSYREGRKIFTDRKTPQKLAETIVKDLEVVTPDVFTPVRRLSGGNVQKVLVGREIANAPKVLMTAYAVRGLDINSAYAIYDLINEQKKRGVAVIFVGEDLDVLLALSDRIMVLCGGKVSGIVDGRKTDKNEIGRLMTELGGEGNEK